MQEYQGRAGRIARMASVMQLAARNLHVSPPTGYHVDPPRYVSASTD